MVPHQTARPHQPPQVGTGQDPGQPSAVQARGQGQGPTRHRRLRKRTGRARTTLKQDEQDPVVGQEVHASPGAIHAGHDTALPPADGSIGLAPVPASRTYTTPTPSSWLRNPRAAPEVLRSCAHPAKPPPGQGSRSIRTVLVIDRATASQLAALVPERDARDRPLPRFPALRPARGRLAGSAAGCRSGSGAGVGGRRRAGRSARGHRAV